MQPDCAAWYRGQLAGRAPPAYADLGDVARRGADEWGLIYSAVFRHLSAPPAKPAGWLAAFELTEAAARSDSVRAAPMRGELLRLCSEARRLGRAEIWPAHDAVCCLADSISALRSLGSSGGALGALAGLFFALDLPGLIGADFSPVFICPGSG